MSEKELDELIKYLDEDTKKKAIAYFREKELQNEE